MKQVRLGINSFEDQAYGGGGPVYANDLALRERAASVALSTRHKLLLLFTYTQTLGAAWDPTPDFAVRTNLRVRKHSTNTVTSVRPVAAFVDRPHKSDKRPGVNRLLVYARAPAWMATQPIEQFISVEDISMDVWVYPSFDHELFSPCEKFKMWARFAYKPFDESTV